LASGWVKAYVEKATGAALPIVAEKDAPGGALISIGHTALARNAGVGADDLKYDGCKLVVRGQVLYLIGRDTPAMNPRERSGAAIGAKGTCRAATEFLEDFLGVRWLVPSPEGEVVPKVGALAVPDNLHVAFNPAFAYAHGRYIYGAGPAAFANNFRTAIKIRSYGGHSYYPWVPTEKYGASNPDYFAVINGKHTPANNHLCTTNPAVREVMRKALFAEFEQGYEWVACGQTDGYVRCECPNCEALDNYRAWTLPGETAEEKWKRLLANPCERLHLTHKWLVDEAAKRYPDRKVHLICYCPTMTPSKRFDRYGDNVVFELTGEPNEERFKVWKGKAAGNTLYICWFDITLKHGLDMGLTPAEVSKRVRFLHENGCIGIYFGGAGENWGFMGPTYYVLGRMLGDPRLDHKTLFTEYCQGLYAEAAKPMADFFDLLYSRLTMDSAPGSSFEDMQLVRYPPRFLEQLDGLLRAAESQAKTERGRQWIRLTRDQFDYNKLLTFALLAYRTYQMNPTPPNWQQLKDAVAAFDAFRTRILQYDDAYAGRWFPGHGHFCNYLTGEGSNAAYYSSWRTRREPFLTKGVARVAVGHGQNCVRYPLTLDFSKPPADLKLSVPRASAPPKLDGKLDDAAWARAARTAILPMVPTQAPAPTFVRLTYDERNLYVAFECDEPWIDQLVAASAGRDGPIWNMDCGEVLLAPDGSRRRYYHFIVAPAESALYDDRTGFKTLNDQDASWNGECRYGYHVDKEAKRWVLEIAIAFAGLGVEPPKPGASWLANFGRERHAGKTGHAGPDLFLWSQAEELGFVDPGAFARILFVE